MCKIQEELNESVRLCLSNLSFTEILEEFDACDALCHRCDKFVRSLKSCIGKVLCNSRCSQRMAHQEEHQCVGGGTEECAATYQDIPTFLHGSS